MVGKTLSHYEILAPLGAGGMGEVYRARDTKLERDVAIKVLPDDLAADPDRLARFEREAKLLAALSHASIGAIHGLEESGGVRFLVLELIEGESLERRLERGAIPVPEALDIARQIAEALEAAHDAGIIHRDVKPANVLLTGKGGVKVLDFGIAKSTAFEADPALTEQATSLTIDGTLMGTPPYMAPEQIRGEEADKRADIWAFGCVVYEMLAGRGAFARETVADTLVAVLEMEPDWDALPRGTSPQISALLRRCLRKDVERRIRDVGDVRIEIEDTLGGSLPAMVPAGPAGVAAPPRPSRLTQGLVAIVVILVAVLIWDYATEVVEAPDAVGSAQLLFTLHLPPDTYLTSDPIALSSDGALLAFSGRHAEGGRNVYVWNSSTDEIELLADTEGAQNPFFSPDGQWIGFFVRGALKKVAPTGGSSIEVAATVGSAGFNRGAVWTEDGQIVFGHQNMGGMLTVAEDGGDPLVVKRGHFFQPTALPGGRMFLGALPDTPAGQLASTDEATIVARSLDDGSDVLILEGGSMPRFVPPGFLVYSFAGTLRAVRFDSDQLRTLGPTVEVVSGVNSSQSFGRGAFAVSKNGTLAYAPGAAYPDRELVLLDRDGEGDLLTDDKRGYYQVDVSPDGKKLALIVGWHGHSLWTFDTDPARKTFELVLDRDAHAPVWTVADELIFNIGGSERQRLFRLSPGMSEPQPLGPPRVSGDDLGGQSAGSTTPDGATLVYNDAQGIKMLPLKENGLAGDLIVTDAAEAFPDVHPGGEWVAYQSNEPGRNEIYLASMPDGQHRTRVSTRGGQQPKWSIDGSEIFYRNGAALWSVQVEQFEPEPRIGVPEMLFEVAFGGEGRMFDVMPDGEHFVVIRNQPVPSVNTIKVWVNFVEALKELLPPER